MKKKHLFRANPSPTDTGIAQWPRMTLTITPGGPALQIGGISQPAATEEEAREIMFAQAQARAATLHCEYADAEGTWPLLLTPGREIKPATDETQKPGIHAAAARLAGGQPTTAEEQPEPGQPRIVRHIRVKAHALLPPTMKDINQ